MINLIGYWLYAQRIYIAVAIIMTMMTSSFQYYVWRICVKSLEANGYHSLVPVGLYSQLPLHLFPAAFLIAERLEMHFQPWKGDFLWGSPFLVRASTGFLWIWAAGFLASCIVHIVRDIQCHLYFRDSSACKKQKEELFQSCCGQLKIKPGKIELLESFHAPGPLLIGIFHPKVILPEGIRYTEEELRMIFLHELMHYRQHALLLRKAAAAVSAFQWMNPAIRCYRSQVVRYTEFSCDEKTAEILGMKYYSILERFGEQGGKRDCFTYASLGEGGCGVLERIEKAVVRKTAKKNLRHAVCALLLSAFAFLGMTAAGTEGIAEAYVAVLRETEVISEPDILQEEQLVEHFSAQINTDVREVEPSGEMLFAGRSLESVHWNVPSGVRYRSGLIAMTAGEELTAAGAIDPGNKTVRVGIIYPDMQTTAWVEVQGGFNHTFSITENGTYRFYVENHSGTTVEAGVALLLE